MERLVLISQVIDLINEFLDMLFCFFGSSLG
jgi:hypothetical protein